MTTLTLFTPAGVLARAAPLRRAARRLAAHGFDVNIDEAALARHQRFGGDDDTRLAAIHRVARQQPDVALATRGGYGLTRLLECIDWKLIARSVKHGTRWVGHSDMTALQLGLLAHTGAQSWAGPLAAGDFGGETVDDITQDCFVEAMCPHIYAGGHRSSERRLRLGHVKPTSAGPEFVQSGNEISRSCSQAAIPQGRWILPIYLQALEQKLCLGEINRLQALLETMFTVL